MDKFLGKYNLSKLNKQETEILNTPITADEMGTLIKRLLTHTALDQRVSKQNSTKHLRKS